MMATCSIEGCEKTVLARGYCSRHYNAWRKHGDPLKRVVIERGSHEKWIADACNSDTDDCVVWPFKSQYRKGYGMTWFRGSPTGVHRTVCILVNGEPPIGTECAHSCGNNKCANPRHLRWATPVENQADKIRHGTDRRGEANAQAKLSEENVREILDLIQLGRTHKSIADQFGVSRELVSQISRRVIWKHVERSAA
jgi:hypothetical protein